MHNIAERDSARFAALKQPAAIAAGTEGDEGDKALKAPPNHEARLNFYRLEYERIRIKARRAFFVFAGSDLKLGRFNDGDESSALFPSVSLYISSG